MNKENILKNGTYKQEPVLHERKKFEIWIDD